MTLPERDLGYLQDINSEAALVLSFTKDMTYEQFVGNPLTLNAVLHCLTIIGEAAGRLSAPVRERFPQFDWSAMKGMRHILVHEYGRVNYMKVWDVIRNDIPPLHAELTAYLAQVE